MSSRILGPNAPIEARPWRAGGSDSPKTEAAVLPGVETRQSKNPGVPRPADPGGVDPSRSSLEQTRIRELEGSVKLLERKAEDEKKTAREQGRQEGLIAGAQQEAAKWTEAIARLGRSIEEMSKAKTRFRAEVEEDAVKLALVIARKILNRELASDPEALVGLARVALGKLNLRDLQRVRVHPADAPAIDRLMAASAGPQRVEIVADKTLERGAAIFESERGTLDASVTTQLGEIERGLADLLGAPSK